MVHCPIQSMRRTSERVLEIGTSVSSTDLPHDNFLGGHCNRKMLTSFNWKTNYLGVFRYTHLVLAKLLIDQLTDVIVL